MDQKQFIQKLNSSLSLNQVNQDLLKHQYRHFRAKILFKLINSISKLLKYFDFRNNIIFEDKIPFIKIEDIKLMICNHYYLKHVSQETNSNFSHVEKFLSHLKINPTYILDIGACWGECSIYLASKYKNAKLLSIEGSLKNYEIFKVNLSHNKKFNKNIIPYHLIISDQDGDEEISNDLSTFNMVKKNNISKKIEFIEYITVESQSLLSFINKNKIPHIDFMKIDIEGYELNLVNDLLKANINSLQIEIINYTSIDKNLDFLLKLNEKYKFHEFFSWKVISFDELKVIVSNHLKNNPTIDIFLSK